MTGSLFCEPEKGYLLWETPAEVFWAMYWASGIVGELFIFTELSIAPCKEKRWKSSFGRGVLPWPHEKNDWWPFSFLVFSFANLVRSRRKNPPEREKCTSLSEKLLEKKKVNSTFLSYGHQQPCQISFPDSFYQGAKRLNPKCSGRLLLELLIVGTDRKTNLSKICWLGCPGKYLTSHFRFLFLHARENPCVCALHASSALSWSTNTRFVPSCMCIYQAQFRSLRVFLRQSKAELISSHYDVATR